MTDETSTGVRLEATTLGSFWQANSAAGSLALGALAFLVIVHRSFRTKLGG